MPRPIKAIIHSQALAHNLQRSRSMAHGSKVFTVVKANAYGHGIERVYPSLTAADGFALLDFAEAQVLRGLGWRGPILLLEGCFEPSDLLECQRLNLWQVIHSQHQIDWLQAYDGPPQHVFLKLNSGMNRLGFAPEHFRAAWSRLRAMPQVSDIVLMTHFSDADGPRGLAHQRASFCYATKDLPGERSLSNSAAILRHCADHSVRGDWVRAGIMTYGSSPDFPEHSASHWNLRPTMTLRSKVLSTQRLRPGDSVGYGSSFVAEQPMRIGIVACGYADGYPRHAQHGTPVLVDGRRTGTVGRISMDMLAVDLTEHLSQDVGSEVTLWGRASSGGILPIDQVALCAKTIAYELMCAVTRRVPVEIAE